VDGCLFLYFAYEAVSLSLSVIAAGFCVLPCHDRDRTCALMGHRCFTLTQQHPGPSPPIACGHVRYLPLTRISK
jgi:hypothetical protein